MYQFYVVDSNSGVIVETLYGTDSQVQVWAQETANEMNCPVYVIRGEHSGMEFAPEPVKLPADQMRMFEGE